MWEGLDIYDYRICGKLLAILLYFTSCNDQCALTYPDKFIMNSEEFQPIYQRLDSIKAWNMSYSIYGNELNDVLKEVPYLSGLKVGYISVTRDSTISFMASCESGFPEIEQQVLIFTNKPCERNDVVIGEDITLDTMFNNQWFGGHRVLSLAD